MAGNPLTYPSADRDAIVEVLHGVPVADPYRYLEEPDAERTRAFVAAQNALSEPYLAALPARAEFGALTTALLTAPRSGVPWERGGRYFAIANPGELDQDQLFVADSLDELLAGGRLLLDPNTWSTDGAAALTGLQVSADGAHLAYARAEGGSDWRTIRIVEVATGVELADELTWTKWVDPTWLPDGRSFLYWRYPQPAEATDPASGPADTSDSAALTDAMGAGELVVHRVGTEQGADQLVWSKPEDRSWMVDPWVSDDQRWLLFTASPGTDSRTTVSARRLSTDATGTSVIGSDGVIVVAELADAHTVVGTDGDTLYLRTERDAPTGALVAVDLADPSAPWRRLVGGEPDRVLAGAWLTAAGFALLWSVDAAHRLELADRSGQVTSVPDLGSPISLTALSARPSRSEIFVGTSSFAFRQRVYRIEPASGEVLELPGPAGGPELPPVISERRSGISADGTAVPMSLVRRPDLPPGPRPTLLYGYGGFDHAILPTFSSLFASWVAAGGVLAVVNLRGGGEFGSAWHEAGMLHHKQRVFDDLYGCAEALIADGVTTPAQLAVHGRSNGGLLVGAAMTQRPELWAAALPTVGVMDMLRFHLFTIGWAWTTEYGNPDDADDFAVLRAYSPLHRLREGTVYPPTLICTGDHDDRVVPAHSLKFGAELQRCQAGPGPVLLRVDTRAGHGMGKPARALAAEYADQLAFAAHHTGLVPLH